MKAKYTYKKLEIGCFVLLLCFTVVLLSSKKSPGYIMPAEQLIDFMASNFKKFKTLVIIQSTLRKKQGNGDSETVFKEQIWMKSPNLFQFKGLDRSEGRTEDKDIMFRQLLIANKKDALEELLSGMGINLRVVTFTRIDGIIAYRIGNEGSDSPRLLIEKERFFPLLLQYRVNENSEGDTIRVHFRDYRKLDEGWYPFEIIYSVLGKTSEVKAIQTLEANVPVNSSLFYASGEKPSQEDTSREKPSREHAPGKGKSLPDEERLRKIIKAFEKKYQ